MVGAAARLAFPAAAPCPHGRYLYLGLGWQHDTLLSAALALIEPDALLRLGGTARYYSLPGLALLSAHQRPRDVA